MPDGPANGCQPSRSGRRPRAASMGGVIPGERSSRSKGVTRRRAGARARRRQASMRRWAFRPMARRTWPATCGSGRRAGGRRKMRTVCFGAALGTTIVSSPPARIATTITRTSASTMWGFVAPGHNLTLWPFPFYPLFSVKLYSFGCRAKPCRKYFGEGRMARSENVLTRTDDFIKWFLPKIEKFPRNYKFLFGDRLAPRPRDFFPGRGEHVARGRCLALGVSTFFSDFRARQRVRQESNPV